MKRLICFAGCFFLLVSFLSFNDADAVMSDYCVVPPYVIQDVSPNIMMIIDNSGSMFNIAYACTTANATSSGTNTTAIPVNDISGFKPRQWIALVHGGTTSQLQISSTGINTSNKTITVTKQVSFSIGDTVQDWGCNGNNFYDGSYTCANTYATAPSSSASLSTISVHDASNFWVGEIIVVVHSSVPNERVITAITPGSWSTPDTITVDSAVTVVSNDKIYDYNCYYLKYPYPEQSFDPTKVYYGYFLDTYFYTYDSSGGRFVTSRLKAGNTKTSTEWDGNFMNWLTMRRVDVLNKVMTGGKTTTNNRLVTRTADYDGRGIYKAVLNADARNYMGCTTTSFCTDLTNGDNVNILFASTGSNPSSFTISTGPGDPSSDWSNRASYNLYVVVPDALVPVSGVLQDVSGTRARLGVTFYNTGSGGGEGGFVQVPVAAANLSSAVNQINNMTPNANTPLAETLWTVGGYFAQQSSIPSIGSPGPRYHSGDYQINNNVDPMNFGQGGTARFPSCAQNYVLLITDGEPCEDGSLPSTFATYANTNTPFKCSGSTCPAYPSGCTEGVNCLFNSSTISCGSGHTGAVAGLEQVALYLHTHDLRNNSGTPSIGVDTISGNQNLTLYTVFAFGSNSTLLKYTAINGGFTDLDGNNQPNLQSEWDSNGDGVPDNYYDATDGSSLEDAIRNALSSILKRASSGTAASVLASGEGKGANLIQAVFYPRRRFGNDIIAWIGEDQNFWYYVDPLFKKSSIREDTVADDILNLRTDYVAQFYFDQTAQVTMARRFQDVNGDGSNLVQITPPVPFESLSAIWQAGKLLWSRDISTDPRSIYTPCLSGGTCLTQSPGLMSFQTSNQTALRPYMNITDNNVAGDIIGYTQGQGLTTLLDEDGNVIIAGVDRNGDGIDDYRGRYATIGTDTHVWKLGDIVNSTPKIASFMPLNNYDTVDKDSSYKVFTSSSGYVNRGMVFAGGNDGMLHAIKLGKLDFTWSGKGTYDIARISGTNPGREEWAFIPKNVLPYLQYIADPAYCHVFSVDLTPFIFDVSIGAPGSGDISALTSKSTDSTVWRTIVVGGMRYGGGCRKTGTTCTTKSCSKTSGTSCTADNNCPSGEVCLPNCVNTPLLDPSDNTKGLGYSSYFALDVTDTLANPDDPVNHPPQLLWEFSNENLGFATTGPAVVRISGQTSQSTTPDSTNGKWFVIFGSGPTGPIETTNMQFLGRSDQNLNFFILDLKTGALLRTLPGNTANAFAGSMFNGTVDTDLNYQDDAVYVGYTSKATDGTWTNGGVGRILTIDPATGWETSDTSKWTWNKVIDGIGPVTSAVARLESTTNHILWLYFGTGRYFYEIQTTVDDDIQRSLYGIKDPCFTSSNKLDANCTTLVSGLTNVTSLSNVPTETSANAAAFKGWYILLDPDGTYANCEIYLSDGVTCAQSPVPTKGYRAERVLTDTAVSTSSGLVFFTTYKPYSDECGIGGKSFIWATRYNTGGAPTAAMLKGLALLQVSTGSIEQKQLSSAFPTTGETRKSSSMEGVPPTGQGLSLLLAPPPARRVVHMRER